MKYVQHDHFSLTPIKPIHHLFIQNNFSLNGTCAKEIIAILGFDLRGNTHYKERFHPLTSNLKCIIHQQLNCILWAHVASRWQHRAASDRTADRALPQSGAVELNLTPNQSHHQHHHRHLASATSSRPPPANSQSCVSLHWWNRRCYDGWSVRLCASLSPPP